MLKSNLLVPTMLLAMDAADGGATTAETEGIYAEPETAAPDSEVDMNELPDGDRPYLPQNYYVAVIIGATAKKSKASGNLMIEFEWEVVHPRVINFSGRDIIVEGAKLNDYCSLQKQALGKLKTLHKILGLPATINTRSPAVNLYLGRAVKVVIKTDSKVMTVEGTNEPLLGPDGKPIANNQYRLEKFIKAEPEFNREIPY